MTGVTRRSAMVFAAAAGALSIVSPAGPRRAFASSVPVLPPHWILELPVPRIRQYTSNHCGPASCLMYLRHFGLDASEDDWEPQRQLFDLVKIHNSEPGLWASDPGGVAGSLDDFAGVLVSPHGAVGGVESVDRLLYNLIIPKMPNIALVRDGWHWVVIDGAKFVREAGFTVAGFFVSDPGASDAYDRYVPIAELIDAVLTPNTFGSVWLDQRVVISDGAESTEELAALIPDLALMSPLAAGGIEGDALEIAVAALSAQGFLVSADPAVSDIVLTVDDQDREQRYFLVRIDGATDISFQGTVTVAVDPVTGSVLEAATGSAVWNLANDDWATQRLADLGYETAVLTSLLVWRIDLGLRTKVSPARAVQIGGMRWYLRTDLQLVPDPNVVTDFFERRGGN